MAVVFQENMLFNMSIRENLRSARKAPPTRSREARARRLHRYIMSPARNTISVGERAHASVGHRQRIAIALAIVIRITSVLLLDKATSASTIPRSRDHRTSERWRLPYINLVHHRRLGGRYDEISSSTRKAIERGSHAHLLAANCAYRKLWTTRPQIHNATGQGRRSQ